ncbi:MAG: proline--tRNA ligase [Candidatus Andersenbacteria bacterium]
MLTTQAQIFSKARKEAPAEAEAISHRLLTRAGYIDQLASGIFSLLPLGVRVTQKIEAIIRQEMAALGAQEVLLPALQPAALWARSKRLDTMEPPLFRLTDRHDRTLVLASTHEEVITELARKNIESYKDLPVAVYQIQTKFRNETRATGGLLRVREFQMKDLYSFHRTAEDLQAYYDKVKQSYIRIFEQCDLTVRAVEADSGSIGGSVSHEFSIAAPTGEDKVLFCSQCDYAANLETQARAAATACPRCGGNVTVKACIENGHIFQLGAKYSEALEALYTEEDGTRQPLLMGCYGIGIGRLMATIVETHHDDRGIVWPTAVSPYDIHLIVVHQSIREAAQRFAEQASQYCAMLIDDRDISAGQKFAEADLLGISTRVVMSEKTEEQGVIEVTQRATQEKSLVKPDEFLKQFT